LNYYKKLLSLRKSNEYSDVFVYGDFKVYNQEAHNLFMYTRSFNNKTIAVVVNMRNIDLDVTLPFNVNNILLTNYNRKFKNINSLTLKPFEAIVFEI
jgi:glycosidase